MRGRKPVPTPLKLVRGNPGKRAINHDEPQGEAIGADYPPPAHLGEIAAECWRSTIKLLADAQIVTALDLHGLELYCIAYQTHREAQEQLVKTGPIVKSPKSGYPIQSPFFSIANKAHDQMVKLAAEFGLTPSSRSRVKKVDKPKAKNKFE